MNVALDATPLSLTSGGLRRYVEELSLALAREFPADHFILTANVDFALPAGAPENLSAIPRPGPGRWWLHGIRRAIHDCGAQVFHGTNFEVPVIGATPAVMTIHDLSPWKDAGWHHAADRVRRRTPWLLRLGRARMVVTPSEAVRAEVIAEFGLNPDRVRATPLAAAASFQPAPPATQDRYFLCVATLEPRKNIPALIAAWRATRQQTGAELWLVGRTRSDFVMPPSEPGLRLIGEVADHQLPALISGALAFVYPTLYEGFGLPVLEAMQCGCPVITSRDAAVTELAAGTAIHATPEELPAALCRLAADPDARRKLSGAGLARARTFCWARTARATRTIYAELAAA